MGEYRYKTYDEIFTFENLYKAHLKCRRSKRHKPEVIRFEMDLASNLTELHERLRSRKYETMQYYNFTIYEPKKRQIYATRYKDRLVIRCLCDEFLGGVIAPRLIYDNAACQEGKGTHFALDRMDTFLRKHYKRYGNQGYLLKCDIKQYFASLNHDVIRGQLKGIIKDNDVRELMDKYIVEYGKSANSDTGVPLGNQSSQWLGIYYLDGLDRLIKEQLGIKHYIRYMDDFVLLHRDKRVLHDCLTEITAYVEGVVKVELNSKTEIFSLKHGFEFLGWKYYLTDTGKVVRKVKKQSKQRIKRRLNLLQRQYNAGEIEYSKLKQTVSSYNAHLLHGDTYVLRKKLYQGICLQRK